MTTEITPANRALAERILAEHAADLPDATRRTLLQRLTDDTWLRNHPEVSAIAAFEFTALFAGLALNASEHHNLVAAVAAYLAGLTSIVFAGFEAHRASVSAAQERL